MLKVSVIVPLYNVEKYIKKCLDSIVNQTLKDIEIIVVNDGSPDKSRKIVIDYQKKDKRIKLIDKENGGQGSARNVGLKSAKGEYISYVDSDDWIEKEMLEEMYNKAHMNKLEMVICGYKNINGNKIELCLANDNIIKDTLSNKNSKIFNIISPCCKLYKRTFLINSKVEFMENKIWYEDYAYSVKLLSLANKIDYVNKPLYNYLIRENSTMTNPKITKNLDIIIAVDDIISYMKEKGLYDRYYSEIEYTAIENILISGVTRIIRAKGNRKIKKEIINKLIKYMNNNFENYKRNSYLKNLTRNRKYIYKLINLKQYWLISLIFKIN